MTRMTGTISRRQILQAGGAAAVAGALSSAVSSRRVGAQAKVLRILKWSHAIAAYDKWFTETYIKEWGELNNTVVMVDSVGFAEVNRLAAAEADRRQGHDMVMILTPGAVYENHVIDHREVYEECKRRYGVPADFGLASSYNRHTGKYFGVALSYQPTVVSYRRDLWQGVGAVPDSWNDILAGGRQINLLNNKPVGFSLASETNGEWTMRAIMYGFGSAEQDEAGDPTLKSKATLEAIKYVKALYEEAMTKDVLAWDVVSNDRFILNGEGCLTLDTVHIARAGEIMNLPIASDLALARLPEGPARRLGPAWGLAIAFIWNFAANPEGARQFLIDYVGSSRQALLASGFQNMPIWPSAVPDLRQVVTADPAGGFPGRYEMLAEADTWTTNIGHPGHTNGAIGEIFQRGLITRMFAHAATGRLTPDEAVAQAHGESRRIFQKWKESGRI